MAKIRIEDICSGMIIAEPVFNDNGTIELLRAHTKLTERHIEMLRKQSILEIAIEEEQVNDTAPKTKEDLILHHSEVAKKASEESGVAFDVLSFQKDLTELEDLDSSIYELGKPNVINKQMMVNVLTGEGNVPIDVKHSMVLNNTQDMITKLKTSDNIDLTSIKENAEKIILFLREKEEKKAKTQ